MILYVNLPVSDHSAVILPAEPLTPKAPVLYTRMSIIVVGHRYGPCPPDVCGCHLLLGNGEDIAGSEGGSDTADNVKDGKDWRCSGSADSVTVVGQATCDVVVDDAVICRRGRCSYCERGGLQGTQ